jgi:hypothetical protein
MARMRTAEWVQNISGPLAERLVRHIVAIFKEDDRGRLESYGSGFLVFNGSIRLTRRIIPLRGHFSFASREKIRTLDGVAALRFGESAEHHLG